MPSENPPGWCRKPMALRAHIRLPARPENADKTQTRTAGALCKGKHYRQHTPAGLPPLYNNVYSSGSGRRAAANKKCTALTTVHFMILLFFCLDYSPGAIAPLGHTSAQVPQSTQASGLIEYFSPSEIAPLGHSSIQVPHATQSSLIT